MPRHTARRAASKSSPDGQQAKLLSAIEATGLTLPARYPKDRVVDCKAVGSGESALIYPGRYLYRGVIREADIAACANGQVSFRYRNARTGRMEQRTVSGAHFLWLVLQHVLPKGFRPCSAGAGMSVPIVTRGAH